MFVLLCCICFFFLSNNINSVSLDLLRQSSQGPGSTPWPYGGYGQNRDTTNKQVFVGLLGCWPIILLVKIFQLNWLVPVLTVIESGQTEYKEYRDVFLWSFEEHWVWRWFSIHDPPVFLAGKEAMFVWCKSVCNTLYVTFIFGTAATLTPDILPRSQDTG